MENFEFLLCIFIELKTYLNIDQKEDIRRIKEFMNIQGEYKYEYGISVLINKNNLD